MLEILNDLQIIFSLNNWAKLLTQHYKYISIRFYALLWKCGCKLFHESLLTRECCFKSEYIGHSAICF